MIASFLHSSLWSIALAGQGSPTLPLKKITVKSLDLNTPPKVAELMAAGQLGGPLFPTDDSWLEEEISTPESKSMRLAFGQAINLWNKHEYDQAADLFGEYVNNFPDSPWTSEAELHQACEARYNGRYKEAEALYEKNKTTLTKS
jgi:TolA-binding protein